MPDPASLNVAFAGTPDFAARHLRALLDSPHRVVGAYTQPDRPAGRGKQLQASPVKQVAMAADVPIFQPASLRSIESQAELATLGPDLLIVVAYGLLLPQAVLEIPRLGCINVHASLLPRWRGAAPIQRAIEAGDSDTGITIMRMDVGLDTGDMLFKVRCPIAPDDTAATLHDRLAELGPAALLTTLDQIVQGNATPEPQDDTEATYARKLQKEEAELDWNLPAHTLARRIRAFNPFPMAFTLLNEERLRILQAVPNPQVTTTTAEPGTIIHTSATGIEVACGAGSLLLTELQLPGKKAMTAAQLLNGFASKFSSGRKLGR